jgi:hypothetical protein
VAQDGKQPWESPEARPSWVGRCAFIGALGGVAFGAISGLTGIMRTEYKTTPSDHAIILALSWGLNGLFVGLENRASAPVSLPAPPTLDVGEDIPSPCSESHSQGHGAANAWFATSARRKVRKNSPGVA